MWAIHGSEQQATTGYNRTKTSDDARELLIHYHRIDIALISINGSYGDKFTRVTIVARIMTIT